jgi:hypothetical protein
MDRMRRTVKSVVLGILFLLGVAGHAVAGSVVGYWYGTGFQPTLGTDDEFIDHHDADGKFFIHFRTYEGCKVTEDHTEAETWFMLDPMTVRIVTTTVDGLPAGPYTDDYRTIELGDQTYHYVHIQTNTPYISHRVDAHFDFPNCGLTS